MHAISNYGRVILIGQLSLLSPTQPPTLSRTGNEYQPKCGDALRLGLKAGMVHSTRRQTRGW